MVKLSSKAISFVEDAIRELPPSWQYARGPGLAEAAAAWSSQNANEYLTRDAAAMALEALKNAETRFQHELDHGFLGEDEEADVINDIEFIRAIGEDLQRDLGV
jgi:hypothetical protein